ARPGIARTIANTARSIRTPGLVVETVNRIVRSERKLRGELGREPLPFEIAPALGLPVEEVEQTMPSAQTTVSLEKPVGDEEESEFGHFLPDAAPLPEDVADGNFRLRALT